MDAKFTVVFLSPGSRLEDNGETDQSSCILIVTFLLKLVSQWVKYALACVCIEDITWPRGDTCH